MAISFDEAFHDVFFFFSFTKKEKPNTDSSCGVLQGTRVQVHEKSQEEKAERTPSQLDNVSDGGGV